MNEGFETPVLFLIFNRPDTTAIVFEAIRKKRPRYLFIAADGPRTDKPGEVELCEQTRQIATNIDWNCEVKTLFRTSNMGCGRAIKSAIDWFFENVEEGIILEDDCLPASTFFDFCGLMLQRFRAEEKVMLISGTNYLFGKLKSKDLFFFSSIVAIWGWATWKRAWNHMSLDISSVNDALIEKTYAYAPYRSYIKNMISEVHNDKVDTWDIQWACSVLKHGGVGIVPYMNQVSNVGHSGTHTLKEPSMFINMPQHELDFNAAIPSQPMVNQQADLICMKNIVRGVNKAYGVKTGREKMFTRLKDSFSYRLGLRNKRNNG
jgi:hypothetical protein